MKQQEVSVTARRKPPKIVVSEEIFSEEDVADGIKCLVTLNNKHLSFSFIGTLE